MPRTRVEVDGGVCGYATVISVSRLTPARVGIVLESQCPMVSACAASLSSFDWRSALDLRQDESLPHVMSRHIRHTGCPVVAAVAKAVEVEVGAYLPLDAHIRFARTPPVRE